MKKKMMMRKRKEKKKKKKRKKNKALRHIHYKAVKCFYALLLFLCYPRFSPAVASKLNHLLK
jgi:hypothetical protein